MKQISTAIFIVTAVVAVLFIASAGMGLRVQYGVISAVVGSGIIAGMVMRSRADPAFDAGQPDDEDPAA